MISREQVLTSGARNVAAPLADVRRLANMTHREIVAEAIRRVLVQIEMHRLDCRLIGEVYPQSELITNDDLVNLLLLRVQLIEALQAWESKNENGD